MPAALSHKFDGIFETELRGYLTPQEAEEAFYADLNTYDKVA